MVDACMLYTFVWPVLVHNPTPAKRKHNEEATVHSVKPAKCWWRLCSREKSITHKKEAAKCNTYYRFLVFPPLFAVNMCPTAHSLPNKPTAHDLCESSGKKQEDRQNDFGSRPVKAVCLSAGKTPA